MSKLKYYFIAFALIGFMSACSNAPKGEKAEVKEAKEIIVNNIDLNQVVQLQLNQALGSYLAEDIFAPVDVPLFNQSAMDGYAFNFNEKETSNYSEPLNFLYEPNAAILKSGGFHQISKKLNLYKLHQHSHLYTSKERINFPGRVFKIKNTLSYDKKKLLKLLPDKKANITTRNFPKTVAQIRKETKLKDGGNVYIFFTTDLNNKSKLIICNKNP